MLLEFTHMKYTEKNYNAYFFSNGKKETSMCFGMLSLISFLYAVYLQKVFCMCVIKNYLNIP